ncbi:MAG: DUF3298 domain-containing protein, partial [Clostridiales bacterium]|nr:DUF3298 domain-containing protein [Clostridiales bacterium]
MRTILTITVLLTILLISDFADIRDIPTAQASSDNASSANEKYSPPVVKKISLREEGLEIKGELPVLVNTDNLSSQINLRIDKAYQQKVSAAKESKARSITFSYTFYPPSNGVASILLKTSTITAVSKDEADSFNYIPEESRLVGVNDILGPNGLQIAGKVISRRIRADSEHYYTNFPGVLDSDAFYVTDDGQIFFLFDAFQIAPGSEGITSFSLNIDGVINTKPVKEGVGYWIKKSSYSLKMVSLRAACGELNYEIHWDEASKVITVDRPGDITVSFKTDFNMYQRSRVN